jgi:hypothetical protein
MRKTAVACGIVGAILLAAAGLLAFWVTPALIARLPSGSNTALVRDASTVTAGGRQIGSLTSQYAVDRSSLEATTSHPSSWAVTNAKGLTPIRNPQVLQALPKALPVTVLQGPAAPGWSRRACSPAWRRYLRRV